MCDRSVASAYLVSGTPNGEHGHGKTKCLLRSRYPRKRFGALENKRNSCTGRENDHRLLCQAGEHTARHKILYMRNKENNKIENCFFFSHFSFRYGFISFSPAPLPKYYFVSILHRSPIYSVLHSVQHFSKTVLRNKNFVYSVLYVGRSVAASAACRLPASHVCSYIRQCNRRRMPTYVRPYAITLTIQIVYLKRFVSALTNRTTDEIHLYERENKKKKTKIQMCTAPKANTNEDRRKKI